MRAKKSGLFNRAHLFLTQDLWNVERSSGSTLRRRGLHGLRVCALVFKGFKDDQCPLHAAALTFISVMALVPFLAILFAIAKAVGLERGSELLLEKTADMPAAIQQATAAIIATVESASTTAMAGTGAALFLWTAIKMLSNIEESFNNVWGVQVRRTLLEKIKNYIVIIVTAPLLILILTSSQPTIMGFASHLEWMGPLLKMGLQMVPVIMMALAFSTIYVLLPNTKIKFSAAFIGALTAAILSVIFQFSMVKFSIWVAKFNRIYGTLAVFPIFLFWVQMSWMILLLGAEVAFSVQNANTYAREQLAASSSARARLCLAFALMKQIVESFRSPAAPFDAVAYSTHQRIPIRLINELTRTLSGAGLIVESAQQSGCYTLARDPRHISARAIIEVVLGAGASPAAFGLAAELPQFEKMMDESLASLDRLFLEAF